MERGWTQLELAEKLGVAQQIEAIAQLPKAQQRFVSQIIDTVLAQTGR